MRLGTTTDTDGAIITSSDHGGCPDYTPLRHPFWYPEVLILRRGSRDLGICAKDGGPFGGLLNPDHGEP